MSGCVHGVLLRPRTAGARCCAVALRTAGVRGCGMARSDTSRSDFSVSDSEKMKSRSVKRRAIFFGTILSRSITEPGGGACSKTGGSSF
eukprot:5702125-Prymnesium_polylepis.1